MLDGSIIDHKFCAYKAQPKNFSIQPAITEEEVPNQRLKAEINLVRVNLPNVAT
jgi:hypothetical protein